MDLRSRTRCGLHLKHSSRHSISQATVPTLNNHPTSNNLPNCATPVATLKCNRRCNTQACQGWPKGIRLPGVVCTSRIKALSNSCSQTRPDRSQALKAGLDSSPQGPGVIGDGHNHNNRTRTAWIVTSYDVDGTMMSTYT